MQRVPRLRHHGQHVVAGGQSGKLVGAGVVSGDRVRLRDAAAGLAVMGLEEEHDARVLHRVAAVGGHNAVQNGAGNKPEGEIAAGVLIRPGDNGGVVLVVLVVEGGTEAALGRGELVLGRRQLFQCEMALDCRIRPRRWCGCLPLTGRRRWRGGWARRKLRSPRCRRCGRGRWRRRTRATASFARPGPGRKSDLRQETD
jgi:hypothetical protein